MSIPRSAYKSKHLTRMSASSSSTLFLMCSANAVINQSSPTRSSAFMHSLKRAMSACLFLRSACTASAISVMINMRYVSSGSSMSCQPCAFAVSKASCDSFCKSMFTVLIKIRYLYVIREAAERPPCFEKLLVALVPTIMAEADVKGVADIVNDALNVAYVGTVADSGRIDANLVRAAVVDAPVERKERDVRLVRQGFVCYSYADVRN